MSANELSCGGVVPSPLDFDPAMELVGVDEAETIEAIRQSLLGISQTVYADTGHAMRSVHAKSHGLLRGTLTVIDGLAPSLAQGIFNAPKQFSVSMRLSTPPGDVLPDSVSLPRAAALQIHDVPGVRLSGDEAGATQDFVMVNGPVFLAPDTEHFLSSLKLLAATTDKAEGLKRMFSLCLRAADRLLQATGEPSAKVQALGGHPMTHILGETFYTQVPMLWGRHVAKLALVPVSTELIALQGKQLRLGEHPDGLREAVREHFVRHCAVWELRVQLCTDLASMPIEDATVLWPEEQSPFLAVARLDFPQQESWGPASPQLDDALSFSPWHGVVDHRPLGWVMRARKDTYRSSAEFRRSRNACPVDAKASSALPRFDGDR